MLLSRQLTFMSRLIQPAKLATRAYHMPTATSRLYRVPVRLFCTAQTKINPQKMEFKAETKRLLDIVAKSLYTDSEVFIRELLSNASDALEKQRFKDHSASELYVNISLLPNKGQLIIHDNGIGMTRQNLIDHLGTIARSGSKQFVQSLSNKAEQGSSEVKENIIGQFGVGFYSSFIVADLVQVISRVDGQPAYMWSSDGSGQFEIAEVNEDTFTRGTKIIMYMKQEHKKFLDKTEVQQIVQKYSNFINFPIAIDGESVNLVKALWTRNKNDISQQEYSKFYEFLTGGTDKYQYKLHFEGEVPLNIKSILYIPKTHAEKFGMMVEKGQVSLYSKKVLIKKNCKDILLPNFLRFVKGVVDCEDIPLNISRETYQDTALMAKLKSFVTKKLLKYLKDEANKNPEEYQKWYSDFTQFIKQGSLDPDFKKDVIDLNRYEVSTVGGFKSLKEYVEIKKQTQDTIFYVFSPSRIVAQDSPYVYPLTQAGIPVLIANTHIDEIIFNQLETFEGLKFANVQTATEAVQRALKGSQPKEQQGTSCVPQNDISSFSLWIKNELQPFVDKVIVSHKNILGPALVISPISSSMRQMAFMRQMLEERAKSGLPRSELRNLTFQFNKNNELIVKLNEYRKKNSQGASMVVRQIFDNACIESGLQADHKSMIKRINKLLQQVVDGEEGKERSNQE